MKYRSRILVHWTGKDIEEESPADKPQQYVDRLVDYYKKGLYSKRTSEPTLRGLKLKKLVRLCFTEIRMSQAHDHANKYGKMGIGFARDFIIDRDGRPVIYIPFEPRDGLLENSLRSIYKNSDTNDEIHQPSKNILAFIKRMGDERNEDNFEEMEWRIVYGENDLNFVKENSNVYRFPFEASDVKVVIFPDKETKLLALKNEDLKGFFAAFSPSIIIFEDCASF